MSRAWAARPAQRVRSTVRRRVRAAIVAVGAAGLILSASACAPLFGLLTPDPPLPEPGFESYGSQQITWGRCPTGGGDLQCARVYAPLDWSNADAVGGVTDRSSDIELALVKHPAESGESRGTIFVNPGGPGASGVDYVAANYEGAVSAELRAHFDVVGWDPRGVGSSSAVHCLDDDGLDEFLYGTGDPASDGATLEVGSDAWIRMSIDSSAEFGRACLDETGELLGHVDTGSTVRDLDMLREIVGDPKLNYIGYSYGTRIGALYADLFPERVGHLALDGAFDPSVSIVEATRVQSVGVEVALRDYAADCLTRSQCPLSQARTAEEGVAQIDRLLQKVERDPIRADDGRMLYDGTLFTAMVATLYSPSLWPHLDQIIAEVSAGNATHAFVLADYYNDRVDGVYETNLMEAFSAINCVDYPREEVDFDAIRAEAAETERVAPVAGRYQSYGETACADWPVPSVDVAHAVTGAGADPILVVGTTGDPATPIEWARSVARQLESGVLVTFEGEGHTAYGKSACVTDVVDAYFLRDEIPDAAAARCRS